MDYKDLPDSELFMLVNEESEEAKNILYNKYNYIIDIIIKKYSYVAMRMGIDYKELYSEALLGFSDALANYKEDKEASIATFISLCIDRRIQKNIIKASTTKNKVLQESLSLDHVYDTGLPLMDLISDNNENDPLSNMAKKEEYEELLDIIKNNLSDAEYEVFNLMANNLDYNEIALLLNKSPKQIDNAMQRIKHKIKEILKDRNK